MVAQRRFGPLIVILLVGIVVIVVRMFQVQVLEHEIWAREAAGLVRSSRVVPSHRGRFLDRNERELVRDEDCYEIEFCYRDFRRGHPIGLVAHARSALEMRAVTLVDALAHLEEWTLQLVEIAPESLRRFATGEAADLAGVHFDRCADPTLEVRASRASDVGFYVQCLLGLTRPELKQARQLAKEQGGSRSWLELAAAVLGISPDDERARIQARLIASRAQLAGLAELFEKESNSLPESAGGALDTPLDRLVAEIESIREKQEDESADELFALAADFDPGRISPDSLRASFDLQWIAEALRWESARLEAWVASRQAQWEHELDTSILPRALVAADLEDGDATRAQRLVDEIADLYRGEQDQRREDGRPKPCSEFTEACVLDEADSLFDGRRLPRDFEPARRALPFQDPELRLGHIDGEHPWSILAVLSELARAKEGGDDEPLGVEAATKFWSTVGEMRDGLEDKSALTELCRIVHAIERRFRAATDHALAELRGGSGPLPFSAVRRMEAQQKEKFVLVDHGKRPAKLFSQPSYALVERLACDPAGYAGFLVRESTRRVQLVRDANAVACASTLIGEVRRPHLREMLQQSDEKRRFEALKYKLLRSAEEELEFRELGARLKRPDDWTGSSGLEGYFDLELCGRAGRTETTSLEDRKRGDQASIVQAAVDGLDVVLTIDADMQNAAQEVLAHPQMPPTGARGDSVWCANPVGAIVLLTPDGEVLVAASEPAQKGYPAVPGRGKERSMVRDRTLQSPTFNPPGSVVKPFVSAYALDKLGFDPTHEFRCDPDDRGKGGHFETMHCLGVHEAVDLHKALLVSCNSFFAQVGLLYQPEDFVAMAHTFGFGEPTGVAHLGRQGRSGLRDDPALIFGDPLMKGLQDRRAHMQFANGLHLMQATPMQVARATAAIATGALPEIRIALKVGDVPVPKAARDLGFREESLAFVRQAMRGVVAEEHGTAHIKELEAPALGFTFACKTGSADVVKFSDSPDLAPEDRAAMNEGKMRKHAWIAGWFPAEAPRAILVVYLHNVSETSSHIATYVAAQFLRTEAVKRFVAAKLAEEAR